MKEAICAADIHLLIEDPDRIALVAQPIADLERGGVVGYETLSRFTLDRPAPPDVVFRAAEVAKLGDVLEALVLKRALALAAARPRNCFVTVNVDPRHLTQPNVQLVLERHRDLGGIVIELTEHASIEDIDALRGTLGKLRDRGAFIAVDDAGSGYSGLKQILEIAPQFIKLDRALVTGLPGNEAKRALVQMLGELAQRLDAWLLAEGIETEEELRTLRQLGVPLGQGYFLARPKPPWTPLDRRASEALFRLPRGTSLGVSLEGLVETCHLTKAHADWPENGELSVRVADGRPIAMLVPGEGGAHVRTVTQLLQVKRRSLLCDIALRASMRPEPLRWDPVVCVDERGVFEGVIPLQRIVAALATRPALAPLTPPEARSPRMLQ